MFISSIQYRKLDFEEFSAAAISMNHLKEWRAWNTCKACRELFVKDGSEPIMFEELAIVFSSVSNGKFRFNCLGTHPLLTNNGSMTMIMYSSWHLMIT